MKRLRLRFARATKQPLIAIVIGFAAQQGGAADITWDRLLNADRDLNNWLTYHGSFKSWHYSGLDQINKNNVSALRVEWVHNPGPAERGVQSFPLVADGVLYYTSSSGQVWALNAVNGALIWHYQATIDEQRTSYGPYNRGLAIGYGKVFTGTVDGRMIALDQNTGRVVWDTMILTAEKGNQGFTGAPVIVKDKVLIGSNGGALSGCCGPIFAVNALTGAVEWRFDTIGGDERSRASWGNESWKTGGGGGWMTGSYDPITNSVWWGTANPAPVYDWSGEQWMHEGPRPGLNLYSSSVVVLDADTGRLKAYFSEMPHDAWDFDSAVGEFVQLSRGGKRYVVHPNKGGAIFVYDADPTAANADQRLSVENAYLIGKTFNYVRGVDAKTGELIGRRELPLGEHTNVCPAKDGAISWNAGSYNPNTGLYYKVTQEWCMDIAVQKIDRPPDFSAQAYIGASWTVRPPEGREAFGTLQAFDPITSRRKWEVELKYPPLASLLSSKGGLLFVPGADGTLYALDAGTGVKLWQHHNGLGHQGGVISYAVKGKQYLAVVTGWGSHVSDNYCALYGEPFCSMPTGSGQLMVFALP
jgi:PQQ-dependent dehydrogenase (methanol/ethanol family)